MYIGNHAHDAGVSVANALCQTSERTLAWPLAARGSLVDDDDGFALAGVLPVEVAPLAQVHAHGVEVARRHDVDESIVVLLLRLNDALCRQAPAAIAIQRKHVGNPCGFDAGKGFYPLQNILKNDPAPGSITPVVVVYFDGAGMVRLKSQIHVEHTEKTSEQQAGADEQHARQCDLRYDERRAHPLMLSALTHGRARIFESFLQIASRNFQSRNDAKHGSRNACDEHRPTESGSIDSHAAE